MTTEISADRYVAETGIEKLQERIGNARNAHPDSPLLRKLAQEAEELREELSVGDWARIGVVLGLLWNKLDTVTKHLSDIAGNTGRTASAHR